MRHETKFTLRDAPLAMLIAAFLLLGSACTQRPEGEAAERPAGKVTGAERSAAPADRAKQAPGEAPANAEESTQVCSGGSDCPPAGSDKKPSVEAPQVPQGKVGRIVFLDKENCCDCTRNRQNASWNNLQEAMDAAPSKPPVDVIHVDSQADQAAVYLDLDPVMVTPGLYFFDHKENLLEMVQGEVSREQIEKILN